MGELDRPDRERVVVAALPLKRAALATLVEALEGSFKVVDIKDARGAADIVLCPPCSPQTIARLRDAFPGAHVVVIELQDPEAGLRVDGPVARSLAAGASAYHVAGSVDGLKQFLSTSPRVLADSAPPAALSSPSVDDMILSKLDERERRT